MPRTTKRKRGERRSVRDKVRRRASKERNQGFGYLKLPEGVKKWAPNKDGNFRFDIIPYEVKEHLEGKNVKPGSINPEADPGELYYERTFFIHKGLGPEGKDQMVCPKKTAGLQCKVCDKRDYMLSEDGGYDWEDKEVAGLKFKERQLFIIRLHDTPKGEFLILDHSYHLFGKLLDSRMNALDEDEDYDAFADLEGGYMLKVKFDENTYGQAKYYEAKVIDFKPRKEDYDEEILDEVPDLDDLFILLSVEDQEKLLNGYLTKNGIEGGEDEDEDETIDDNDPDETEDDDTDESETESEDVDNTDDTDEDEESESEDNNSDNESEYNEDDDEDEAEAEAARIEAEKKTKREAKAKAKAEKEAKAKAKAEAEAKKKAEAEAKAKKKAAKESKSGGCKECPFGHTWATDCDEYEDCDKCDLWDECDEAQSAQG